MEEPPKRLCFAPCDDNDDPVCSNYGNTHKNLCKLICESNEEFVHEGMCRQCKCAWTNEKVCSTKGITFIDNCRLACAGYSWEHDGPCGDKSKCSDM